MARSLLPKRQQPCTAFNGRVTPKINALYEASPWDTDPRYPWSDSRVLVCGESAGDSSFARAGFQEFPESLKIFTDAVAARLALQMRRAPLDLTAEQHIGGRDQAQRCRDQKIDRFSRTITRARSSTSTHESSDSTPRPCSTSRPWSATTGADRVPCTLPHAGASQTHTTGETGETEGWGDGTKGSNPSCKVRTPQGPARNGEEERER